MPDPQTEAEAKLQKLAQRLRRGWAGRHPVAEKTLQGVREAVRQQWEREQRAVKPKQVAKTKPVQQKTKPNKTLKQEQKKDNSQTSQQKSKGHDHGHSH